MLSRVPCDALEMPVGPSQCLWAHHRSTALQQDKPRMSVSDESRCVELRLSEISVLFKEKRTCRRASLLLVWRFGACHCSLERNSCCKESACLPACLLIISLFQEPAQSPF